MPPQCSLHQGDVPPLCGLHRGGNYQTFDGLPQLLKQQSFKKLTALSGMRFFNSDFFVNQWPLGPKLTAPLKMLSLFCGDIFELLWSFSSLKVLIQSMHWNMQRIMLFSKGLWHKTFELWFPSWIDSPQALISPHIIFLIYAAISWRYVQILIHLPLSRLQKALTFQGVCKKLALSMYGTWKVLTFWNTVWYMKSEQQEIFKKIVTKQGHFC